jgi:hypothetical protein
VTEHHVIIFIAFAAIATAAMVRMPGNPPHRADGTILITDRQNKCYQEAEMRAFFGLIIVWAVVITAGCQTNSVNP